MATDTGMHFHIRWSGVSDLDYERFDSREQADESAKLLVRRDETYSIEQFGDSCGRCAKAAAKAAKPSTANDAR